MVPRLAANRERRKGGEPVGGNVVAMEGVVANNNFAAREMEEK